MGRTEIGCIFHDGGHERGVASSGPSLQPCMKGIVADLLGNSSALLAMVVVPLAIISVDAVVAAVQHALWSKPPTDLPWILEFISLLVL